MTMLWLFRRGRANAADVHDDMFRTVLILFQRADATDVRYWHETICSLAQALMDNKAAHIAKLRSLFNHLNGQDALVVFEFS